MHALLLNASYEPLDFISLRRAMTLVLTDRADLLADSGEEWRSARSAYPVPVLIRLKNMVKVPFRNKVLLNKHTLEVRDGHECQVDGCRKRGTTVDHVVPRSRGGLHEWGNVALMCAPHNERKGDKLLEEIGWKLKNAPHAPRGPWMMLAVAKIKTPREEWLPYLRLDISSA